MHDDGLGEMVEIGAYDGPTLNDKPLHSGGCLDGTYGCTRCNAAARHLSEEDLIQIGWSTTGRCDWCKKEVPFSDLRGCRPWDEGGQVYYEICDACNAKYHDDLEEELHVKINTTTKRW